MECVVAAFLQPVKLDDRTILLLLGRNLKFSNIGATCLTVATINWYVFFSSPWSQLRKAARFPASGRRRSLSSTEHGRRILAVSLVSCTWYTVQLETALYTYSAMLRLNPSLASP